MIESVIPRLAASSSSTSVKPFPRCGGVIFVLVLLFNDLRLEAVAVVACV